MDASGNILELRKIPIARPEAVSLSYCLDCAFILLFWTIPLLLLKPFQNVPFVDDWTYAWPVERLLQSHRLEVLEWSSSPNIVQALWGALFCLRGGFSFASLCFSTWVLAAACLCGLYLLLREMKVSRVGALLGAATLGVNPIFFSLSFTFMTDVPFLALQVWAVLALIRGMEGGKQGWFVAAAILTAFSIGIRPVGVALPATTVFLLLLRRQKYKAPLGNIIFVIITAMVTIGIFAWWYSHQHSTADIEDSPGIPKTRLSWLRFSITFLPQILPGGIMFFAGATGLNLLPLSLASLRKGMLRKCGIVLGLIVSMWCVMHLCGVKFTIPLSSGSIWEWNGFGASRELVPNWSAPGNPSWLFIGTLVAFASMAVLIAGLRYKSVKDSDAFIFWFCVINFGLIVLLWLFHDRYALVVLPFAIVLFLVTQRVPRLEISIPMLAAFLIFSLVGVHNTLVYNKALWSSVGRLRDSGARDAEIDGGYVVNGWTQYAHPENAPRDENGEIFVPWITMASRSLKYKISNQPQQDYELVTTVPYGQWGRAGGVLYILKHLP